MQQVVAGAEDHCGDVTGRRAAAGDRGKC